MLKRIKEYFSEIAKKNKSNSDLFDYHNCWVVTEIKDKNKFISKMIEIVPNDSIWDVWGVFDANIQSQLLKYEINGKDNKTYKFKTVLSSKNKNEIQNLIAKWDFEGNFIAQFIYKDNDYFFSANDNLQNLFVSTSLIEKKIMEQMKNENIINYH